MRNFLLAITAIFFGINLIIAQDLEKRWQFDAVQNEIGTDLFSIDDNDVLELNKGEFSYSLKAKNNFCLLYTSPSPRDKRQSRMPSSA